MRESKKFTASCDSCKGNFKTDFNPKDISYEPDGNIYSVKGGPVDEMMKHHIQYGCGGGSGGDSHNFYTVKRNKTGAEAKKGTFNVNTAGCNIYIPRE